MPKKAGGVLGAVIGLLFLLASCGGADEPREAFIGRYEIDRLQIGKVSYSPAEAAEELGLDLGAMLLILVKDGTYDYRAGGNEQIRRWRVERGRPVLDGCAAEYRGGEIVLSVGEGATAYLCRVPDGDTVFPPSVRD